MFYDILKYIYSESLFITDNAEIKHKNHKNFLTKKQTLEKVHCFSFRELQFRQFYFYFVIFILAETQSSCL